MTEPMPLRLRRTTSRNRPLGRRLLTLPLLVALAGPVFAEPSGFDAAKSTVRDSTGETPSAQTKISRQEQQKLEAALLNDLRPRELFVSFEAVDLLERAVERQQRLVAKGGWPSVPKGKTLRPGDYDEAVEYLRKRLAVTDGAKGAEGSEWTYDESLEKAVRRFQRRHGIPPTGIVDRRTIAALNVPAAARLSQLRVNLNRVRDLVQLGLPPRYVMVNIPSMDLLAVNEGRIELHSRVIVGRTERPSPTVQAKIKGLNFFPFWHVPDSVAYKDLVPKLYKDPGYLSREHIRLLTDFGGEEIDPSTIDLAMIQQMGWKFRQDPGPQNALGLVRVDMPNSDNVYMHDTPMKDLFNRPIRAFSAGCVRVQRIFDLVTWIAASNGDWDRARVDSVLLTGLQEDVKLNEPIDVYFIYLTAWATSEGTVNFRADLYDRDGAEEAMDREEREAPPMSAMSLAP